MERRGGQNIIVPVQMIVWKIKIAVSIIMLFVKVNILNKFLQSLIYVPIFVRKEQGHNITSKASSKMKELAFINKNVLS